MKIVLDSDTIILLSRTNALSDISRICDEVYVVPEYTENIEKEISRTGYIYTATKRVIKELRKGRLKRIKLSYMEKAEVYKLMKRHNIGKGESESIVCGKVMNMMVITNDFYAYKIIKLYTKAMLFPEFLEWLYIKEVISKNTLSTMLDKILEKHKNPKLYKLKNKYLE
ncbi:MAG: hypothetical protein ACE5J9_02190 [Methanosarcinales archaeon]